MKAWQITRLGDPADALSYGEVEEPAPGPGQVKVRVLSAALNFPDVLMCQGKYQIRPELPFTPGVELSGEVVEVGDGCPYSVGQRVFGAPGGAGGGFAEYAVMGPTDVYAVPEGMPDHQAAGYYLTYQTGWVGLHTRARLQAGETLLVHAGAGGVGTAAIQLGKAAGATVIATAGGPKKVQLCRDLGADVAVDYSAEDFVAAVKEATDGRGADVVYDPVGGDVFDASRKAVAFEGRIIVVGFTSGRIPDAPVNHALVKNYGILGLHWGFYRQKRPEVIDEAAAALDLLYAEGKIEPYVSKVYPTADLPEGLTDLASRRTTGKVVLG